LPITFAFSQRAFLCTGNHNYKSPTFDLIVKPIHVEQGAWIGACAFVGPVVTVGSHAVLTAGSVATDDLQPFGIYRGKSGGAGEGAGNLSQKLKRCPVK